MLTFSGSLAKRPQVEILIFWKNLFSSLLVMSIICSTQTRFIAGQKHLEYRISGINVLWLLISAS